MNILEVVCINDKDRPNEVPLHRWVQVGKKYTIIQIDKLNQQGVYGCKLAEINNDDLFPYQYFNINRFAPVELLKDVVVIENELELA